MSIEERVAAALDLAHSTLRDPVASTAIADLRHRLDEPLRVAFAGRVKAGKSTCSMPDRRAAGRDDAGEATG